MFLALLSEAAKSALTFFLMMALVGKKHGVGFTAGYRRGMVRIFVELLDMANFPFLLTLLYLINSSNSDLFPFVGAILLPGMMAIRLVLTKSKTISQCNCYGNLFGEESNKKWLADAFVLCSCVVIVFLYFLAPKQESMSSNLEGAIRFCLCVMLSTMITYREEIVQLLARLPGNGLPPDDSNAASKGEKFFERDLRVGSDNDNEVYSLGEIGSTCSLMLIIGLSTECDECERLKPLFFRLAEAFSSEIRTVFVFPSGVEAYREIDYALVLQGSDDFYSSVGAEGFPFAFVVHAQKLKQLGATEYGINIGRLIFRALNLFVYK